MPTGKQTVEIIDRVLEMPGAGARYWRDRLSGARLITTSQGAARSAQTADTAVLLTAIMVGGKAAGDPYLALRYHALKSDTGDAFGESLTHYLDNPADLMELAIDCDNPAAAIRFRDRTGNIATAIFMPETIESRSTIKRIATLDANAFTALAHALQYAPPATKRRRVRRNRKVNP